ncbi:MAG: hypothetical protein ACR2H4_10560 [Pyrinomonadaceae bacterium]
MPKVSVATSLTSRAQPVLDSLFKDQLIPFQLTAAKVDCLGPDEYIIRFHDSRLRSVDVSWQKGQSFEDVFRASMLDRVSRMSGPLTIPNRKSH